MKILITGITGLVGRHWASFAQKKGYDVSGINRSGSDQNISELKKAKLYSADILNAQSLEPILRDIKPDQIIHLAAQSFNSISWSQEELTHQINFMGTMNLLQAIRKQSPNSKILIAGTSVQYGAVTPEDCPIKESYPLKPGTPYGVSKAAAELLAYQYHLNFDLQIYLPRLFAQLGIGHPPNNAVQAFAQQLGKIYHNLIPPVLKTGNLDSSRDFLDIRDGISAMEALLQKGPVGEPVNVCSGTPILISDLLNGLIAVSGLKIKHEIDTAKIRPADEPVVYGSTEKIKKLGWKPRYTLKQSLNLIFEDWKKRTNPSLNP